MSIIPTLKPDEGDVVPPPETNIELFRFADVDVCLVCGEPAEWFHLCAEHEDTRTWGDRFTYTLSATRIAVVQSVAANNLDVSRAYLEREFKRYGGSNVVRYDNAVTMLLDSIERSAGKEMCPRESPCPLSAVFAYGKDTTLLGKYKFFNICGIAIPADFPACPPHRRNCNHSLVAHMEDTRHGLAFGTTLRKCDEASTRRAREDLAERVKSSSMEDIVNSKMEGTAQ